MKHDARRLTHKELSELRRRAVSAVSNGMRPTDVARAYGVSRVAVFGWLARYYRGGWEALEARTRGGRPRTLDGKALQWLYNTITMKDPRQLQFPFARWSLKVIKHLIKRKTGVDMSAMSVSRLLRNMGLRPQRPLWRAYQQDAGALARWQEKAYPAIRRQAARVHAQIMFGDEAGLRSDTHAGTTWAPSGTTPVIRTTGARFGLNMISAIAAQGRLQFMIVKSRVTADVFITFLRRLMYGAPRPIFLIVDGHPVHTSAAVQRFVAGTHGRLRLFFLPPYSPELNPDELVWNDLKPNAVGRNPLAGPAHLETEVRSHLRGLQRHQKNVRSFFRAETTCYAA